MRRVMNLKERKIYNRVYEKIKLPRDVWDSIINDLSNNIGNRELSKRYNIKLGYIKYIKKIIGV